MELTVERVVADHVVLPSDQAVDSLLGNRAAQATTLSAVATQHTSNGSLTGEATDLLAVGELNENTHCQYS